MCVCVCAWNDVILLHDDTYFMLIPKNQDVKKLSNKILLIIVFITFDLFTGSRHENINQKTKRANL